MKLNLKKNPSRGMTLIEIMIILAITSIIIMIAIPSWLRQREHSRGMACQENLTKIEYAKEIYIYDNRLKSGETLEMTDLYSANGDGYLKREPICPAQGVYSLNPVNEDPSCSYFGNEQYDATAPHALPR